MLLLNKVMMETISIFSKQEALLAPEE